MKHLNLLVTDYFFVSDQLGKRRRASLSPKVPDSKTSENKGMEILPFTRLIHTIEWLEGRGIGLEYLARMLCYFCQQATGLGQHTQGWLSFLRPRT